MFALSKTAFGTGRSLCLVDNYIVTELVNRFLSNKNLVTYRAMLTFGKTCVFTVGSNRLINYLGMTVSRNNLLCNLIVTS